MNAYHKLGNQMKNLAVIFVACCLAMQLQAQETGHFLTVKGGLGATGLQYDLSGPYKDGNRSNKLGWNAEIGYQYFFHENWGIATGVGISCYNTLSTYLDKYRTDNYFDLGTQIDDDVTNPMKDREYQLRVNLTNWHEMQKSYFVEVPFMFLYQHKFGERKKSGFFVGVGAKLLLPFMSRYNVMDAKDNEDKRLWVTGYYANGHVTFGGEGDPTIPEHGFAGIHNPYETLNWQGEAPVKMGVALSGEAGFLIGLTDYVDLTLSAYIDYGLTNMKANGSTLEDAYKNTFKKTDVAGCPDLLVASDNYLPEANGTVGKSITYNGVIMSNRTDRINSMAFGGKIGLRIKLGQGRFSPSSSASSGGQTLAEKKAAARERQALDSMRRKIDVINQKVDKLLKQPAVVQAEPEAAAIIKGIVSDTTENKPLTATVRVFDEDNNLVGIQRTDPNTGAFEIKDVPKGKTCRLEVTGAGYLPEARENIEIPKKGFSVQVFDIPMSKMEVGSKIVVKNVLFYTNQTVFISSSMKEITNIFNIMNENKTLKAEISGHTDNVGTREHNLVLSKGRAETVVKVLIEMGISADRLTYAGYGPDQPIATNETEEGRAQNRRVEFKVLDL
jgi:outer membrane protein OmpA-like peptidoglycan-associated protein